jgi:hypothetical protein
MAKKKQYYCVSAYGGHQAIIAATSLLGAERQAIRSAGTDNFQGVRLATEAEVAWQRAMGGYVPSLD